MIPLLDNVRAKIQAARLKTNTEPKKEPCEFCKKMRERLLGRVPVKRS